MLATGYHSTSSKVQASTSQPSRGIISVLSSFCGLVLNVGYLEKDGGIDDIAYRGASRNLISMHFVLIAGSSALLEASLPTRYT